MRLTLFLCIGLFLVAGCSRRGFFQESALYTGPLPSSRLAAPTGQNLETVYVKAGRHYRKGGFHNFWFGKHYRPVWDAPVPAPVFRPERLHGGLKAVELGGGQQTTSLTLENEEGQQFALRTIDKNPSEVLPRWLRLPFLVNMVRDQTSAINPYAPLVLPPLAKAAGILHTTPAYYFVSDNDTSLGKYASEFRGKVVLFEEKFKSKVDLRPVFGEAEDFANSKKLFRKRFQEGDHLPDQLEFAKARLFDLLIGDWDRHEGQWEWAEYKKKDLTLYRPVPKDRDQAFFYFEDGVIPWIVSRRPFARKFRSFKHEYDDIAGLVHNAKWIDARALNEVTAGEWDRLAREMQAALTDDAIEAAVRLFPDTVYNLVGPSTIAKLKSRRDLLPEAAQTLYKLKAEEVTVVGSDQEERFEVIRLDDRQTKVTVHQIKGDNPANDVVLYSRVFNYNETDLIILHGLEEDDVFEVKGNVERGIRIIFYGGPGEDSIVDTSSVRQGRKQVIVRDTKVGTNLEEGKNTKSQLTDDVRIHTYDREGY